MALIEMEGIVKTFRAGEQEVKVLKGIDLQIQAGEFVSIMGPSGSGKTTLASILGCLSSASGGRFRIDDQDVGHYSPDQLADLRGRSIGYIFQDFNLLEGVTALDNVAMPLVYAGVPARQRRERAAKLLHEMGLGSRMSHLPNQLSGGQKQRVAIARALVNDPKLIFADEATGALDAKTAFEIMSLLQRLSMTGRTIVQVTHSEPQARFSKRIVHLMDGLIVKDEFVERFTVGILETDRSPTESYVNRMWRVVQHAAKVDPVDHGSELRLLLDESTSIDTLIEASKALLGYQDRALNRLVMRLFKHPHWAVRAEIIKNCSAVSQDFALGFFVAGLEDSNAWVRFLAISRLAKLDPAHLAVSAEPISRCLYDDDERVRAAAVSLVGQWRAETFVPRLVELAAKDQVARVRANAIEALAPFMGHAVHGAAVGDAVAGCLEDEHHRVRSTAAVMLRAERPDASFRTASAMLNSPGTLSRSAGAWALGLVADLPASLLLMEALKKEKDELVLRQIVRALGSCAARDLPIGDQIRMVLNRERSTSKVDQPIDPLPESA